MANLSVKLDDATRWRLQEAAATQGQTPHALMVKAIEYELDRVEAESAFVSQALKARTHVIEGGGVLDGAVLPIISKLGCADRYPNVQMPNPSKSI
jgi:predicted transcriptional regulator